MRADACSRGMPEASSPAANFRAAPVTRTTTTVLAGVAYQRIPEVLPWGHAIGLSRALLWTTTHLAE